MDSFAELISQVRGGDQAAAAALVREYEPEIRRYARLRLTDPGLRRVFDSVDICQSVLAAFFVRITAGQFDLVEPKDLVRLLVTMVHNKVIDHARRPASRRCRGGEAGWWAGVPSNGEDPAEAVANDELLREASGRLTEEERELAERRAEGLGWVEIAAAHGSTPDAVRKKLGRALDRVCRDMGLGGGIDARAVGIDPRRPAGAVDVGAEDPDRGLPR